MLNRKKQCGRPSRLLYSCLCRVGDWYVFASDDEQGDIVWPSLRRLLRNASGGYDARDTSDRCEKVKHGRTAPVITGLGLADVLIHDQLVEGRLWEHEQTRLPARQDQGAIKFSRHSQRLEQRFARPVVTYGIANMAHSDRRPKSECTSVSAVSGGLPLRRRWVTS